MVQASNGSTGVGKSRLQRLGAKRTGRGERSGLPSRNLEQPAIVAFIVQPQDDLRRIKDRTVIGCSRRQIRVDQGDDRLDTEIRIAADDGNEVFLLSVVQRFQDAVVIGETGEANIQVGAQDGEVEGTQRSLR